MAVTPIHGKGGAVKKGASAIAGSRNWTITPEKAEHDVTEYGDTHGVWKGGLVNGTGSFGCIFDLTDAAQKAVHDELVAAAPSEDPLTDITFYIDNTNYYSGDVLIRTFNIIHAHNEIVRAEVTFRVSGVLTYN